MIRVLRRRCRSDLALDYGRGFGEPFLEVLELVSQIVFAGELDFEPVAALAVVRAGQAHQARHFAHLKIAAGDLFDADHVVTEGPFAQHRVIGARGLIGRKQQQ